ncbi:MAG: sigma-70 family RNA polymerase sigma factor [Planctomycetota bacterium]
MSTSKPFAVLVRQRVLRVCECGGDAIAGLIDLTSPRLVRLATTITRNQHDGEDAVQLVLARVADQPQRVLAASNAWSYLLSMVRNESLMIVRRRRRSVQMEDLSDLKIEIRVDSLERVETNHAIWLSMRRLPSNQSEVIALKIWESMTFAEISECLDVPLQTVASRYRAGIQRLESLLRTEHGITSERAFG